MKNLLKFNILAITMVVVLGLSSCLKDDEHYWDYSNAKAVIELPEPANASTGYVARALDVVPSVDFIVKVNLASPNTVGKDITVTLALDEAKLQAFNDALYEEEEDSSLLFNILPDSTYSVPSWTVTIPAGERMVDFKITMYADKIDLSSLYILPIKIASVPEGYTIPSNFGSTLFRILVKNYLDGIYDSEGSFNHPASGGEDWLQDDTYDRYFSFPSDGPEADLKIGYTVSANAISCWAGDVGYDMVLTVLDDHMTDLGYTDYNKVDVLLPGRNAGMYTACEAPETPGDPCNYYIPDEKKFVLYYYYIGGTGPRKIYEELTWAKPRP
ncbi:MAG: DUF1735 domain-containing protein [Bacteroidales bacterium]